MQSWTVGLKPTVMVVLLAKRLGLDSVLGYLVAGILIAPWALGLIDYVDDSRHFTEQRS